MMGTEESGAAVLALRHALYTEVKWPPKTGQKVYPYLLRRLEIVRRDQVWCSDITYIPMARGFAYLTAVMDWHSRYVLSDNGIRISMDGKGRSIFNADGAGQFSMPMGPVNFQCRLTVRPYAVIHRTRPAAAG